MPCPTQNSIVGTRHCRLLISSNINSDANGFDINSLIDADQTAFLRGTRLAEYKTFWITSSATALTTLTLTLFPI